MNGEVAGVGELVIGLVDPVTLLEDRVGVEEGVLLEALAVLGALVVTKEVELGGRGGDDDLVVRAGGGDKLPDVPRVFPRVSVVILLTGLLGVDWHQTQNEAERGSHVEDRVVINGQLGGRVLREEQVGLDGHLVLLEEDPAPIVLSQRKTDDDDSPKRGQKEIYLDFDLPVVQIVNPT